MEVTGYVSALFIGLFLGLFSGVSILTVAVLVCIFSIAPVMATTCSLLAVDITSAAGAASFYQKGDVNLRIAFLFGTPAQIAVFVMHRRVMPTMPQHLFSIGSFATAGIIFRDYLRAFINEAKLKPAFGWFVLLMGLFVLFTTMYN
ncbi:TSUP family transporter [Mucilaginibacter sp.]